MTSQLAELARRAAAEVPDDCVAAARQLLDTVKQQEPELHAAHLRQRMAETAAKKLREQG